MPVSCISYDLIAMVAVAEETARRCQSQRVASLIQFSHSCAMRHITTFNDSESGCETLFRECSMTAVHSDGLAVGSKPHLQHVWYRPSLSSFRSKLTADSNGKLLMKNGRRISHDSSISIVIQSSFET